MIKPPTEYIKPTAKEKIIYKTISFKCKLFGHHLVSMTEYDEYTNKVYSLCQRCQRYITI